MSDDYDIDEMLMVQNNKRSAAKALLDEDNTKYM
jgi:hypothetical protein